MVVVPPAAHGKYTKTDIIAKVYGVRYNVLMQILFMYVALLLIIITLWLLCYSY